MGSGVSNELQIFGVSAQIVHNIRTLGRELLFLLGQVLQHERSQGSCITLSTILFCHDRMLQHVHLGVFFGHSVPNEPNEYTVTGFGVKIGRAHVSTPVTWPARMPS